MASLLGVNRRRDKLAAPGQDNAPLQGGVPAAAGALDKGNWTNRGHLWQGTGMLSARESSGGSGLGGLLARLAGGRECAECGRQATELEGAQRELGETQRELGETRGELEGAHRALGQALGELERVRGALGETQRELGETRGELEALRRTESGTRAREKIRTSQWQKAKQREQALREELERVRSQATPQRVRELERELARARRKIERQAQRQAAKDEEIERLRSYNRKLKKMKFGRKSEKRGGKGRKGEGRKKEDEKGGQRGQRKGKPSPGRRPRTDLEVHMEELEPPEELCRCPECNLPYGRHGKVVSEVHEIEVKAHTRRVERIRYRPVCECPGAQEALAPPPPRLFPGTPYGVSVWSWYLVQAYALKRPQRAVARELGLLGLEVPAGTLAGHQQDFLRLFEPLEAEIARRQQDSAWAHGDETSWTVHVLAEQGANPRCWLWVCVTADAVRMRVDAARSAQAAARLFGELGSERAVVLVCDRYSAYPKLARDHEGQFVLQLCWAHQRRDFVDLQVKRPSLEAWGEGWLERIGGLYALNAARLEAWDPEQPLEAQGPAFQALHKALVQALDEVFEAGRKELGELPAKSGQGRRRTVADMKRAALESLLKHEEGLRVFVGRPFVPLDNNTAERALRGAAIGRKLSHGSFSERGAELLGCLYSVYGTLELNGINPWRWTQAYLQACAEAGGKPPPDIGRWTPWGLTQEQLEAWKSGRPPPGQGPAP